MITIDDAVNLMNAKPGSLEAEWLAEIKKLQWIPVTYHEPTEEDREWFGNVDYVLDCPLPDYGQEIIISRGGEVSTDVCGWDGSCCYLEGTEDWRDVDAWMPLPEPYRKED